MNAIIEQIHSEFSEAEELLIKDVNALLAKAQTANKENINALSGLGFSNFRELREISPEEIEKAKNLKQLVTDYKMISPLYKFITDEKVISICKKYGLVHAPVSLYTDSIPVKNQQEILAFNEWFQNKPELMSKESLKPHNMTWNSNSISNMTTDHIINTLNWISENWSRGFSGARRSSLTDNALEYDNKGNGSFKPVFVLQYTSLISCFLRELYIRKVITKEHITGYAESKWNVIPLIANRIENLHNIKYEILTFSSNINESLITIDFLSGNFVPLEWGVNEFVKELNPTPEYSIVAAEHMINCVGKQITEDYKVIPQVENFPQPELRFFEDDDPIVLMKVDKGYLIVTAWGAEASDEDVVNHQMN